MLDIKRKIDYNTINGIPFNYTKRGNKMEEFKSKFKEVILGDGKLTKEGWFFLLTFGYQLFKVIILFPLYLVESYVKKQRK